MRHLSSVAVLLCVAACGSGAPASNTTPTTPTAPSPVAPSPFVATGAVTLDGTPARGARVSVMAMTPRSAWPAGDGITDAAGRYRIPLRDFIDGLAQRPTIFAVAADWPRLVQPCVASAIVSGAETQVDVQIVSAGVASSVPAPTVQGTRSIIGTIFEATPGGRQPVAGALVAWELWDTPLALTRSDADGRYSLCGLPREPLTGLWAMRDGYAISASHSAQAGIGETVVDIELKRR